MWKATASSTGPFDEGADRVREGGDRLGADVELLIAGRQLVLGRAVFDDRVARHGEGDPLLAAVGDDRLRLRDAVLGDVPRLVAVGGVLGGAEADRGVVELADRLADRHGERAGGEDLLDRAAGDHRLHVVELVDLDAAEDGQIGLQALLHRPVKLAGGVLAQRDPLHGGRHGDARRVERAGAEGLVDVDRADPLREAVSELRELRRQAGDVPDLRLPEDALDVVLAGVLQDDHRAVRGGVDGLLDRVEHSGLRVPPIFDERNLLAEQLAEPLRDLLERALRLAADVAEDDLLPAASPRRT